MFLFIDNYDSFSYNLVQAFLSLGHEPVVVYNDDPRLPELARDPALRMVCLSPGPGRPEQAGLCGAFLDNLPPHIPVLGVCLGHQILGQRVGADITVAPCIMHGKSSEIVHDGTGLFHSLPHPLTVGRYHSLLVSNFDHLENPPFTVVARGPEGEVMALRYTDRPWVGVQFHPESILTPEGMQLLANFPQKIMPLQEGTAQTKTIPAILERLACKQDLNAEMAASAFAALLDGRMTPSQAGSFLMGLRMKGESALELAHATRAALARAVRVEALSGPCIDVVGTGGDGRSSFNCSTATALVLAGMGYKVVKHGNRAVSSTCGSADALESLGIPLNSGPQDVATQMQRRNFAFLFAPHYHPAFANIGPIRQQLGVRTLFNLLGPLVNPARPSHLLMGVAHPALVPLLAETLRQNTVHKAAIVCGAGEYDEITPMGPAVVTLLHQGKLSPLKLDPADFGIAPCSPEELAVHSKEEAVAVLRKLLAGEGPDAMRRMLVLNVGLALYLLQDNKTLHLCMLQAREAVLSGAGRGFLHAA